MADDKVIVEIGAEDTASKKLEGVADKAESVGDRIGKSFKNAQGASTAFTAGIVAAGAAVLAYGAYAFKAFNEAQLADKQLEHAVLNVTKATDAQLQATRALADELERKGVLDGDNIKVGLAQLSTFGLTNEAVQGLGGALADLAVNQFGVNASGEQLSQTANMMAKALKGQFGVLEKSGIRFTEAQQAIIMTGTEMEKVAAINEGFAQNLKLTNEVAMQTAEGLQAHLGVQLGNIHEAFGALISAAVMPLVSAFSQWLDQIGGADAVVKKFMGAMAALQPWFPIIIGAIIGGIVPAFGAAALAIGASVLALAPWIAAGAAVAAVAYLIYQAYQTNFLGLKDFVDGTIVPMIQFLMQTFADFAAQVQAGIELLKFVWETNMYGIRDIATVVWNGIVLTLQTAWKIIENVFKLGIALITGDWEGAWKAMTNLMQAAVDFIGPMWDGFMKGIGGIASSIWEGIKATFKNGINAIIQYINGWIGAYNRVVEKVPGGKSLALPNIPQLANGGIVTSPTLALIGEAGPEAVIPLSRGRAGGGMGSVEIRIEGNSFFGGDDEFVRKISDQIMRYIEPHISFNSY